LELLPVRKVLVPEEVHDLLERGVLYEVMNVVPAIDELARSPVDVADRRRGDDDVFEPEVRCSHNLTSVGAHRGDIHDSGDARAKYTRAQCYG
jgi:hypothetical protein